MESVIKRAILRANAEPENDLLVAIRDVCRQIDHVQARFEMECDSDLIDSCIYELEALRARYRYLLRQARCQGLTASHGTPLWEDKA